MSLPSIEALTIGYFFNACTAALTKKDMKPRRTPCSFSKRSWYFFLRSTTGCILTSLKVVRIAAVDCDCTRRSAMRARSRLKHVALCHAAAAAAARHHPGVDAFFLGDLPRSRHGRCRSQCRLRGGRGCRGWLCLYGGRGARDRHLALGVDGGDDLARLDRAAVGPDDFREDAVRRGGKLEDHLVGFDVDEVLVALDGLADFLVPREQRGFRNRFRELRHFYFDKHVFPLF